MTGSRNSLFAKRYIKSSLKVRKERVIFEFSIRVFFSTCSSVQIEFSSEKLAGSISLKLSQKFCSKSENENKRLIFQKKVAENVLPGHIDCSSELYQKSFNRIEKKQRSFQNSVLLQIVPLDAWEADVTTLPLLFCSKSKHGENLKSFSFKLLCPKVFHWRWWMLTWQSSQYRLKLR